MFGVHLEKRPNRFELMKQTHPQLYSYCIKKLGIGKVLNYIDVEYGQQYKLSEVKVADGTPTTNGGIPPNTKVSGILPTIL
jgi:hypothetical protein